MELQKRQYQEDCLNAIFQAYNEGCRQQLVVAATGTGKAVIIARLFDRAETTFGYKPKMLVFAHREELVNQLVATMTAINPDRKVGKEMAADYADADCNIIVSCVASIGREGATRLKRFGNFDIVVCDEAHHSIASTYLNVFEATGVLLPDSKRLLVGFTATPKRKNLTRKEKKRVTTLDQENILQLSSVYKKIVYSYPIRKAIKEGWLSRLKGFRFTTGMSLDDVTVTAGDFQQDELQDTVNTPQRNQLIVKSWLDKGEGRSSVGFCAGIKHAQDVAEMFRKYGVKAEAIWGIDPERNDYSKCDVCGHFSTKEAEGRPCNARKSGCHGTMVFGKGKRERHEAGDFDVMLNAQLLTEGYDNWRIRCVLQCAPTINPSKFTQEVGRGTRIQEGIGNLVEAIKAGMQLDKTDCYVFDFVDNTKRNSLVTFPSLLGLNSDMDLHGTDLVTAAETLEAAQEKYPGVSFENLVDIRGVKAYIESVDLFANPFDAEVLSNSKLSWAKAADSSYVLHIPERRDLSDAKAYTRFIHERLVISDNELGEQELSIITKDTERKLGTFNTLQEAFATAEEVVSRCRADRMKLLLRESSWHSAPASAAAKKYLRRLSKKRPLFKCLCEGSLPVGSLCPSCKKEGLSAGQAALALNILKTGGK